MVGGVIDVILNAAHPELPLFPVAVFASSPWSVRVINVPTTVGSWTITAVHVSALGTDNATRTVSAVRTAGFWVATLPGCAVPGEAKNGFVITADGVDENGNAVTGYCLGVGDVVFVTRDTAISAGGVRYYLHYCAEQPETPQLGDTCYIGGVLQWYNGSTWQPYAEVRYSIVTDLADSGLRTGWTFSGDAESEAEYRIDLSPAGGEGDVWNAALYEDGINIVTNQFSSPSGTGRELLTADFVVGVRTIVATRQIVRALADRAANGVAVAAPGSGNTASAAFALPPAVPGKLRDLELYLTFGVSAASEGDISVSVFSVDGAAPAVDIGADALADIAIGRNLVVFSEIAANHWFVSVKHEDFPAA